MLAEGDRAPDFRASLANGDIGEFRLSKRLNEAPLTVAFFPGVFRSVRSHEMTEFGDRTDAFGSADATVYGISGDSPLSSVSFVQDSIYVSLSSAIRTGRSSTRTASARISTTSDATLSRSARCSPWTRRAK
jgi:hypothetical protein